jgi:hypothetical protein
MAGKLELLGFEYNHSKVVYSKVKAVTGGAL